jgi:peptidoglycan/xylan/chitin deacetylase (PgdA/CDA1 family)
VPADELDEELAGSAAQLQALGLPRPRALAYPHGEWTPEVARASSQAGYDVAFTVDSGVVERGVARQALPRVEVLDNDTPIKVRIKVATAGWPSAWRVRVLRLFRCSPH